MAAVVEEAKRVYEWVRKEVPGGAEIYAFNSSAWKLSPEGVKRLKAGGGTCLSCFFNEVKDRDFKVAIVISDGLVAPEDLEAVKRIVKETKRRTGLKVCSAAVGGAPEGIANLKAFSDIVFTDSGVRSAVRKCLGRAEVKRVLGEKSGVKDPDAAAKLFF
jgi:undecaprenyl pyrophosphate synthase